MAPCTPPTAAAPMPDDERVKVTPQTPERKYEIIKVRVMLLCYWYLAAVYGIYLCFTTARWATIVMGFCVLVAGTIGITAGAHRLWSHRSYKANLPLQVLLMLMSSSSAQYSAFNWARDHRMHHKYSDTDADPHNPSRGFFFAHIGWLLVKKHPEIKNKSNTIDMSDLLANPVLMFQRRHEVAIIGTLCFVLPTVIPIYLWGEPFNVAWNVNLLRVVLVQNLLLSVNSFAHKWGYKPYDTNILPTQNPIVSFFVFGEGFHNYHHTFPWDYKTAELGDSNLNLTKKFIDFFAWIGWAYDLKTAPENMIRARAKRTGDGSCSWGCKNIGAM